MSKKVTRKTLDEVLEDNQQEPELNPDHVNDWHFGTSAEPFKSIERDVPLERRPMFNIKAAISSPKSIRYRQMNNEWDQGKKGDYLFIDASGNKMGLPYLIFKRLF